MADSVIRQDFGPTDGAVAAASVVTPLLHPTDASDEKNASHQRHEQLKSVLEDAERLIRYAAEMGIEVGDDVRQHVLAARTAASGGWTEAHSANLLWALTQLSVKLKPVSGESLRACVYSVKALRTIRSYRWVAIILAVLIIPFSVAAFVATATCEAIGKDIEMANALAVTLTQELVLPPSTPQASPRQSAAVGVHNQRAGDKGVKDLQLFAATIRAIDARAVQLKFFAAYAVPDPFVAERADENVFNATFQLPAKLDNIPGAAVDKIKVYQNERHFAQGVQEAVATVFGAATSCILPMLYALLGACAYLIRSFEEQVKTRSFTGVDKPTARFLIAGIGGLVVGLFGNFGAGHGATLPPLAIAFLVGYAVDVFFTFLEGLSQTFSRSRGEAPGESKSGAKQAGSY